MKIRVTKKFLDQAAAEKVSANSLQEIGRLADALAETELLIDGTRLTLDDLLALGIETVPWILSRNSHGNGSGYGNGFGYGNGYGNGSGDGYGSGYGDGYGYGSCSGYGNGNGSGYGDGKYK